MKNALARLRELERLLEEHKRKTSEVLEKSRQLLSQEEPGPAHGDVRGRTAGRAPGRRKRPRARTTSR
jgi:hypothetical protein